MDVTAKGNGTQLNVTSSLFGINTADAGDGGAIHTQIQTTLTDDTFASNAAKTANNVGGNGGAIAFDYGVLSNVDGCSFQLNKADVTGGAIKNLGRLTVDVSADATSVFDTNTAGTNGGAIDSDAVTVGGALSVNNTNFLGNNAGAGIGGAINTADPTILYQDIFGDQTGNSPNVAAFNGGAVSTAVDAKPTTPLTVLSSAFYFNQVINAAGTGGAIDTSDVTDVESSSFFQNQAVFGSAISYTIDNQGGPAFNSSLTVNKSYFERNDAPQRMIGNGGGVLSTVTINSGTVNVSITNSTFTTNGVGGGRNPGTIDNGGGVDLVHNTGGTGSVSAVLTNDTFFQNAASDRGGGLALFLTNTGTGQNTGSLTSLTVNANMATNAGGGLFVSAAMKGVVTADNSIFDGNNVTAAGY